jgi:hypothetical protein
VPSTSTARPLWSARLNRNCVRYLAPPALPCALCVASAIVASFGRSGPNVVEPIWNAVLLDVAPPRQSRRSWSRAQSSVPTATRSP